MHSRNAHGRYFSFWLLCCWCRACWVSRQWLIRPSTNMLIMSCVMGDYRLTAGFSVPDGECTLILPCLKPLTLTVQA